MHVTIFKRCVSAPKNKRSFKTKVSELCQSAFGILVTPETQNPIHYRRILVSIFCLQCVNVNCIQSENKTLHLSYVGNNFSFTFRGQIKSHFLFKQWNFLSWRWHQEHHLKKVDEGRVESYIPVLSCRPLKFVQLQSLRQFQILGQSPAGKNMSTEAENPSPGNDCWRHSRLRRICSAVVNCRVCELAIALQLLVVRMCKRQVNPITSSNPRP
jgi:hypothetical protein